jgi:REP element-mobilizing transposase RayT
MEREPNTRGLGGLASSRQSPPPTRLAADAPDAVEWFSRGYLPHRDLGGLQQSVTFRLADSLPRKLLAQWSAELAHLPEGKRQTEREKRIRTCLDQSHGACWLRDPRVAEVVENALLHFDGRRYRLLAWCVMPNHVHGLVETCREYPLPKVVHAWKSYTASEANKRLGRKGAFWQREYHDRYMRDAEHLRRTIEYIELNPVKAGLVPTPGDWRFSSARHRPVGGISS